MTELIEPAKEENKTTMDSEKTTALVVANENKPSKKKKGFFARPNGKEKKGKKETSTYTEQTCEQRKDDEFNAIATLLNSSRELVKQDSLKYQMHKFTKKLGMLITQRSLNKRRVENVYKDNEILKFGRVVITPMYFQTYKKALKSQLGEDTIVTSLIDFPLGESTLKGKLAEVRLSRKYDATEIMVVISPKLAVKEQLKQFKKQVRKICSSYKNHANIVLNVSGLDNQQLKHAIKVIARAKSCGVTALFGNNEKQQVLEKIEVIKKHLKDKQMYILTDVDSPDVVSQLHSLGFDMVISPNSDKIGYEVVDRLKIKIK